MPKIPELRTDRLILRGLRARDAEAIAEQIGDWDVIRMLARPPYPYSAGQARDYLSKAVGYPWEYAVTLPGDDRLMGIVGVTGHLGYWLGRAHWGRGYMTEAAGALVDAYFATAKSDRIISGAFSDNPASAGVLRKLGFAETGRSRQMCVARGTRVDHLDFALTRHDWMARAA
ncbi:MAG: GNAT family protein [Pseudomonadota bacterium]